LTAERRYMSRAVSEETVEAREMLEVTFM
jgi:hypothetical protein